MDNLDKIFKAYDVRGIYPDQLNKEVAYRIGQAYAAVRQPRKIAVGRDVRSSGEGLKSALISALLENGVDVVDIGTITTDQLYFTVGNYGFDGGIAVTASHNPGQYNGFKFAEAGGGPISSEDLISLRNWAMSSQQTPKKSLGSIEKLEIMDNYTKHVLSYIDKDQIKPFKIVANANFGAVGRGVDIIAKELKLKLIRLNWQEDGTFPKGPPNPLLPKSRAETINQIKKTRVDLGVAWDADADRCFFYTGQGQFVPSAYIVALLAEEFLIKQPGAKIVHDATTAWVIDDTVHQAGGQPITSRTGHTFVKAKMRQQDAIFAGESSGHYYFRDSFYADNGLVPFLIILQMLSETGKSLDELVKPLMDKYTLSDEINFEIPNPQKAIDTVEEHLGKHGVIDKIDGLIINTNKWRLSIRPSNTEPLVRLNAEAHSQKVLDDLVDQVSLLISNG